MSRPRHHPRWPWTGAYHRHVLAHDAGGHALRLRHNRSQRLLLRAGPLGCNWHSRPSRPPNDWQMNVHHSSCERRLGATRHARRRTPRGLNTMRDHGSLRWVQYHTWEVETCLVQCASRRNPGQLSLRGRHAHHGPGHPNEDTDEGPTTTWAAPLCDRLSDDCVLTDYVLT